MKDEDDGYSTGGSPLLIDGVDFSRVYKATETSFEKMAWARRSAGALVKEFAGPAYGGAGGLDKPLNKMNQLVESYVMLTAANRPTVEITPKPGKGAYKGFARLMQDTTNNLAKEIKLEETLLAAIQDAFFGVGVVKIHRDSYRPLPIGDSMIDPGIPSASVVPLDDWVFDTAAKKWSQIKYCGDKYRVAFSRITEGAANGTYDPKVVAQLTPTSKTCQEGDKMERISTGAMTDDDELEPMIDLADIWIASTGRIYTCALEDPNTFKLKKLPPLGSIPWKDPDNPPHHLLRFSEVPHNVLPVAPASHLDVLDRGINNVARKEMRRVRDQKENPIYAASGEEAAKNIKNAGDNEWVRVNSVADIGVVKSGGVDQNMHMMLLAMLELFDQQSGNLSALAGLGSSADTLGQEQIIANASNRKVGSLQNKVAAFASGIFRSLGFMLWEDEILEMSTEVEAGGFVAGDTWKPYEREGNFLDYNFDINAYSMPYTPPAAQAQLLMSVVERIFLPAVEMMAAQGGQVDFAEISDRLATMLNMPAIKDCVKFTVAPDSEETPASSSAKPPSTTRNYTRTSVPSQGTSQSRLSATLTGMQTAANQVPSAA